MAKTEWKRTTAIGFDHEKFLWQLRKLNNKKTDQHSPAFCRDD
jgi:hypothetical protein